MIYMKWNPQIYLRDELLGSLQSIVAACPANDRIGKRPAQSAKNSVNAPALYPDIDRLMPE